MRIFWKDAYLNRDCLVAGFTSMGKIPVTETQTIFKTTAWSGNLSGTGIKTHTYKRRPAKLPVKKTL